MPSPVLPTSLPAELLPALPDGACAGVSHAVSSLQGWLMVPASSSARHPAPGRPLTEDGLLLEGQGADRKPYLSRVAAVDDDFACSGHSHV